MIYSEMLRFQTLIGTRLRERLGEATMSAFILKFFTINAHIQARLPIGSGWIPWATELVESEIAKVAEVCDWADERLKEKIVRWPQMTIGTAHRYLAVLACKVLQVEKGKHLTLFCEKVVKFNAELKKFHPIDLVSGSKVEMEHAAHLAFAKLIDDLHATGLQL